jgi:hydrogenase maturation protease
VYLVRDALPGLDGQADLSLSGAAVAVIGVGNELRGDDGAGPAVVCRLRSMGLAVDCCGGGLELLELWQGAAVAIVVDAVATGAPPGTIHRLEAGAERLPTGAAPSGTHALGLSETIEFARAMGRLPPRVVVYGIEAETFELGAPLSAPVSAALPVVAARVRAEVMALT